MRGFVLAFLWTGRVMSLWLTLENPEMLQKAVEMPPVLISAQVRKVIKERMWTSGNRSPGNLRKSGRINSALCKFSVFYAQGCKAQTQGEVLAG